MAHVGYSPASCWVPGGGADCADLSLKPVGAEADKHLARRGPWSA